MNRIITTPGLWCCLATVSGLYGALTALMYVLHRNLAYAFTMRATDGKAKPPFKVLNPHREGLLAIGAGKLHPDSVNFFVHTQQI